jgi:hypothetical protein
VTITVKNCSNISQRVQFYASTCGVSKIEIYCTIRFHPYRNSWIPIYDTNMHIHSPYLPLPYNLLTASERRTLNERLHINQAMKDIRRIENKSVFVSRVSVRKTGMPYSIRLKYRVGLLSYLQNDNTSMERLYPPRHSLTNTLLSDKLKGTECTDMSKPF